MTAEPGVLEGLGVGVLVRGQAGAGRQRGRVGDAGVHRVHAARLAGGIGDGLEHRSGPAHLTVVTEKVRAA